MVRVAIVTTHPIQYQVPWFRELDQFDEIDLTVLFCMLPDQQQQGDGFGVAFDWDVPLLEGYRYEVLQNTSKSPGMTRFSGCDTPEIGRVLKKGRFDAVIVNGWVVKSCLQTLWACKRLGIPCIVRGEANDLTKRVWWKRFLQQQLVRQYSACLYIGECNRNFYMSRGVPESKLFPARYCVNNEHFERLSSDIEACGEIRDSWGVDEETCVFLYCGKLIPKKHPLELIRAFSEASSQQANCMLVIVGDGELRTECEQLAETTGAPITFQGFVNQSELPLVYAAGDCLVLPSDAGETWGLVTNEAMACGRPAIVSDAAGCHADLIKSGETGERFAFGDWKELSLLLEQCARSRAKLHEMGKHARDRIQRYSPKEAAVGTREAIRAVTQPRSQLQSVKTSASELQEEHHND